MKKCRHFIEKATTDSSIGWWSGIACSSRKHKTKSTMNGKPITSLLGIGLSNCPRNDDNKAKQTCPYHEAYVERMNRF